ncbi:tripartite tricarboxylate transporter permease [Natronobacterium texcoconense]|uniref:Putative tricarboxylic transport membrane protein n=1 Tax=Natronobacterium texcoconense TaxID=1095778 RepID=A0A1H1H1C0_NATTX|nr:tripartite tricarboxylate transporter permease [Natronobacterium texcoconense]SDR19220.1 putative tricarboxylic transport membrane protein [Natronobacterium texcoconense]
MAFEAFVEGIHIVFSWPTIGWMAVGVLLGIFVGAIPGIGPNLGMAIVLPLTIPLGGANAIILLVGIYSGSMYGGSIAAILVNVPGTAAAAATTFDGYPMSRQGMAATALSSSAVASALAGFMTIALLILISPLIVTIVLMMGSPEYFLVAVLGLSMITIVARGSMVKGLVAGAFGLLLTTIGIAPMSSETRFTGGSLALFDGISFVAAILGLFAIAEMLKLVGESGGIARSDVDTSGDVRTGIREVIDRPVTLVKSAFLGMGIGSLPGSGAAVSNFVAYGEAVRSSASDKFGNGEVTGVIAAEASNNGTVGGSLIPALSFGIPGSGATAVLLGGLLMHGLQPGPELFETELSLTYSVFIALFVGNILILSVGLALITKTEYLTRVNTDYLIPVIIVLAIAGGFTLRSNWFDVATILLLGAVGYYMFKHDYSVIAFILGIVLGPIAEENFLRSLQLSDGSWWIFVESWPSRLLVVAVALILLGPPLKSWYVKRHGDEA